MQQIETSETSESLLEDALRQLGSRLGGDYRAGQRLPTVRQLADDLNLSPPTVYRAIRKLVRGGFLITKSRQGVYVSDRFTDARLQFIFSQQTGTRISNAQPLMGMRAIIYLPPDSTHMWPTFEVINRELSSRGCELIRGEYQNVINFNSHDECKGMDIVIMINPDTTCKLTPEPHQHLLMVSSAAVLPQMAEHMCDLVSVEQEQGASLAGRYLRAMGCDSAAYLGVFRGPAERGSLDMTSYLRLHGFEQGWGEAVNPSHYLSAAGYSQLWGAKAAKVYAEMNPRPRGLFVASDDMAIGLVNGLTALGLEMDRDYNLVSFDGQRNLLEMADGVCCVTVPAEAMGHQAVQLLLSRLAQPDQPSRKVLLGCELNRAMPSKSRTSRS